MIMIKYKTPLNSQHTDFTIILLSYFSFTKTSTQHMILKSHKHVYYNKDKLFEENILSRLSRNYEANASRILKNLTVLPRM